MNASISTDTITSFSQTQERWTSRRATLIKWLRKMHGWIGLWGATLGLLFGTSGVLLNHRAVLKIPAVQIQESNFQLALPASPLGNVRDMASWLQHELKLAHPASRVRSEPARPVAWGDATLQQPEHWMASFTSPTMNIQTDYWVGNGYVTIKRSDNNFFAMLTQFHKGVGMSVGWILLVDTLAGSIILLSLSGVLLWILLNRRRLLGASIAVLGCGATVTLILVALR